MFGESLRRTYLGTVLLAVLMILPSSVVEADWFERDRLVASDGASGDFFGFSVSSGGGRWIVGARSSGDSGSAYIFERQGESWTERHLAAPEEAEAGSQFGISVAVGGTYALVGAHNDHGKAGSVYVYMLKEGSWELREKLVAEVGSADDHFGRSVAMGEGYLIIGADGVDELGEESGCAYIFELRPGGRWRERSILLASDGDRLDRFGDTVSMSGDYAAVGAHYNDSDSGSAYVFERVGREWIEAAKITAPDRAAGDFFGSSVCIRGERLVVGSPGDDDKGDASGSAYIFERDGALWKMRGKLTAADGSEGDQFGMSVAMEGDYCVVGALLDADGDGGRGAGSAYLFHYSGGVWVQKAKLVGSEGAAGDLLGTSVAVGSSGILAGAPGSDGGGSAYLFGLCPPADLDGDCRVDFFDCLAFADRWLSSGCSGGGSCGGADLYKSGAVDWADFGVLAEQWLEWIE